MSEPWTPAGMFDGAVAAWSTPWCCQVVHHVDRADGFVLDLIALEPCPADPDGCPAATPFTLQGAMATRDDPVCRDQRAMWVSSADVVTLVCGATDADRRWVCLSSAGRLLLLMQ